MGDGEAANITKTYANVYQICAYLYILPNLLYSPYVAPGAIHLAKCTAPPKGVGGFQTWVPKIQAAKS